MERIRTNPNFYKAYITAYCVLMTVNALLQVQYTEESNEEYLSESAGEDFDAEVIGSSITNFTRILELTPMYVGCSSLSPRHKPTLL